MNTFRSTPRSPVSHIVSEMLLLILLVVSIGQIGLCLSAGCLLLQPPQPFAAAIIGPVLSTNAPLSGGHLPAAIQTSAGFPSGVKRG
jgi:hypothetical protein